MLPVPYWRSDCGRHTLYHGDCLAILPHLSGVDAVVTDPPYSSGGMMRGDRTAPTRQKYQSSDALTEHPSFSGDNRDQRGLGYWCALWMSAARDATKSGAMFCTFTDWRQLPTMTDVVQAGGWVWRGIVPWDKVIARPQAGRFRAQAEYMIWATNGARDQTPADDSAYGNGIIRVSTPPTNEREHATQKPVELLIEIINTACQPEGLVLDPFAGSGTTGVACAMTGRRFIGIELDEGYCAIAKRRIEEAANHLFVPTETNPPDADPPLFD